MSEAEKGTVANTPEADLTLFHHGWGTAIRTCTATGNSDHSLNQECGIRPIYLKGASDGDTRKIDIFVHLRYTYERMHPTR